FAVVLLRGFVAGLAAAVCAVVALVFCVEVLDARLWALTSPASYPPMPSLPQPRFLPVLSWPQADILLLLPPLAAVLAGVYHVLFGPPEARLIEALARRVAAARAPIEAKLVGLLLVLALGAVALGWVGFSALEPATRRLVAAADAADGTPATLPVLHEATLSAQRAQLGLAEQVQNDTQEFQNQTDLQHHGSLIAVMALVGLIAAAGVVLGQAAAVSITRPLGAVTNQLAHIGRGDFSPRLALANRDELGDLAGRLNAVTAELDRLYSL